MDAKSDVVESVLAIIQENPGLSYDQLNEKVKTQKLKTNRARLNILINDLIVRNQVRRTVTSPKRYYLNLNIGGE